jgi:hypothetical protein
VRECSCVCVCACVNEKMNVNIAHEHVEALTQKAAQHFSNTAHASLVLRSFSRFNYTTATSE